MKKHALWGLDADIRDHIERETQDNIERGMSPEEARDAASRKFGNVMLVREDTRAVWIPVWLDQFRQASDPQARQLLRDVMERAQSVSGVDAATLTSAVPLTVVVSNSRFVPEENAC
jgi:hypothetical protein